MSFPVANSEIDALADSISQQDDAFDALISGGSFGFQRSTRAAPQSSLFGDSGSEFGGDAPKPKPTASAGKKSSRRASEAPASTISPTSKSDSGGSSKKEKSRRNTVAAKEAPAVAPPTLGFLADIRSLRKDAQSDSDDDTPPPSAPKQPTQKPKKEKAGKARTNSVTTSAPQPSPPSKSKNTKANPVHERLDDLEAQVNDLSVSLAKQRKKLFRQIFLTLQSSFEEGRSYDSAEIVENMRVQMRDLLCEQDQQEDVASQLASCARSLRANVDEMMARHDITEEDAPKALSGSDQEKQIKKLQQDKKSLQKEVAVWQKSVPELRRMMDLAVEERDHAIREKNDVMCLQEKFSLTWVPDQSTSRCHACTVEFSVFKWRNHCRYCGRVFCFSCTSSRVSIPELGYHSDVSVCDHCLGLINANRLYNPHYN